MTSPNGLGVLESPDTCRFCRTSSPWVFYGGGLREFSHSLAEGFSYLCVHECAIQT